MSNDQGNGKDGLADKPRIACSGAGLSITGTLHYLSIVPLTIIAVVAVFYVSTMREGHDWGDDFGMYLLHAKSIVEGKGYTQTSYRYNPLYSEIGPKAYPPVTPIALAPVYRWFGLNVTLLKITVCAFFVGALWVLFWTYRIQLPTAYAAGLIILLGFNPYFWDFKDEILSDFPFLFFVWTTLYAVQRHYKDREKNTFSGSLTYAIVVGVLMYLAYGTRVIGAVLPASLCLYELVRFKRLSRFAVVAILVAGILIGIQATLLSDVGGGYGHTTVLSAGTPWDIANLLLGNVISYLLSFVTFLENGHSKPIKIILFVIVSLLATLGFRRRIKDGITILEIFFFFYFLALLVTSRFAAFRYVFPIIPIYYFYACIGAMEMRSLVSRRGWQYAPIILAGAIVLSYASNYTTFNYGPIQEGIGRQESKELFQYIKEHTDPSDVIIFRKPRALALLTAREVAMSPMLSRNSASWDEMVWKYFQDIGARYIVLAPDAWKRNPIPVDDIEWERQFIMRYKNQCQEVFSNADFKVYELKGCLQNTSALHLAGS